MSKKRGALEMQWIHTFYWLLAATVFIVLLGFINGEKDDTNYTLSFYSRDIAYTVETMLWNEADISLLYPLKEGYSAEVAGETVLVRKGASMKRYSFRSHPSHIITVEQAADGVLLKKKVIRGLSSNE